MKTRSKYIIGALCLILLAVVAVLAVTAERRAAQQVVENAGSSEHADRPITELEYNGESAALRKHVDTVLLIGTDSAEYVREYGEDDMVPYYNYEQADVLFLLVLDNDAKTCTPIQINRDTMVDDPWLSVTGEIGGTVFEQIALSHTSGSGLEDSCENSCRAVSTLMFNAPVDNYLCLTMNAIPILNDLVGGVTVTIVDDMTPVDKTLVQGETVTLRGQHALNYIRARMSVGDGLNVSRMRRHRDYMEGFIDSARKTFSSDSELTMKAIEALNPYMVTDLTAEAMSELAQRLDTYTIENIKHADGENKLGEKYYEFYVDHDDLWRIVKQALC